MALYYVMIICKYTDIILQNLYLLLILKYIIIMLNYNDIKSCEIRRIVNISNRKRNWSL